MEYCVVCKKSLCYCASEDALLARDWDFTAALVRRESDEWEEYIENSMRGCGL